MKVYWLEDDRGYKYGNARLFTNTGPPKLYGTRKQAERTLGHPWSGYAAKKALAHIVEGELTP